MDDKIPSKADLERWTGLSNVGSGMPTLGSVMRIPVSKDEIGPNLMSNERHPGLLTEAYKFLQTNLEFAALGTSGLGSLLVTSAVPGEGKTTTAMNLAVTMAREGKSVILVDADLRKPALHRAFDLGDRKGVTNYALGDATLEEVMASTTVENLRVVPCGPMPPDSTVVLRSPKMKDLIQRLVDEGDIVILDSPPLLSVTDPMLLAPLVTGVLMVVDVETTGRNAVKRGAETLKQATPPFAGTVLNKVSGGRGGYYGYYHYYDYNYGDGDQTAQSRNGTFGILSKVFAGRRKRDALNGPTTESSAATGSKVSEQNELGLRRRRHRNANSVRGVLSATWQRIWRNGGGN